MLIFLSHQLAYLATPKTGTTATEHALRPHAEIVFARNRKHLTAQRFQLRVAPFLEQTFSVKCAAVAVMRDPVDQIRSWYRYRQSPKLDDTPMSSKGMSFEEFALAVISEAPPPAAQIGSQHVFLTAGKQNILVDHLFAYEEAARMQDFFRDKISKDLAFKEINVSQRVPASISEGVLAKLRAARADEFALYEHLTQAGGYLHTPR
ncbi:hypothetical protein SAMN04488523_104148 [Sulfitobacter brevis]|uniref:Sulfotransferase family protein n=1 Tax=Sulfitobacter brevis TaxID=74348 RepID=A0A1I1WZC0_9RHOB|nr:hypothetical protein [Sulfitobacter brevis]SFD98803.1 hypothetical protein SAMN04488523_104148 [Sulfitobacter brevis]